MIGVIMFIFLVASGVTRSGSKASNFSGGATVILGFLLALFGLFIWLSPIDMKEPTGEYGPSKLEVVLTDENYIIDASKYRIIDTRGKILTLEEVK